MDRQKNSGFTVIEIIIVLFIMAILATIVIVSLRTSRNAAEDRERKDDVEAIARNLEAYHRNSTGYPAFVGLGSAMSGIEVESLKAPGDNSASPPLYSLIAGSSATAHKYVYQPLNSNNTPCTTFPCMKFKIHYTKSDGTTEQKESINQ